MDASMLKQVKGLEQENPRLKRMHADSDSDEGDVDKKVVNSGECCMRGRDMAQWSGPRLGGVISDHCPMSGHHDQPVCSINPRLWMIV